MPGQENANESAAGTDTGYVFSGPHIAESSKTLGNGRILVANHQAGVVISENPTSPWHHATFLSQGTTIQDADGKTLGDAALCEFVDPDGDLSWMVTLWWYAEEPDVFQIIDGTGKWKGITGTGTTLGMVRQRADDHFMPRWEINWAIDRGTCQRSPQAGYQGLVAAGDYTGYDTGYSFHGPHVVRTTKTLSNGLVLEANSQSGVLVSENPESPFHRGVSVGCGTTIKTVEGKTLGDVMIGETIDADGDLVWNYHTWWYAEGGGWYGIIGGTGKWEGITGVGKTLGMVRQRADDHFMLRWEAHWRVDR